MGDLRAIKNGGRDDTVPYGAGGDDLAHLERCGFGIYYIYRLLRTGPSRSAVQQP